MMRDAVLAAAAAGCLLAALAGPPRGSTSSLLPAASSAGALCQKSTARRCGASVFSATSGPNGSVAVTNRHGRYRVAGLNTGTYRLVAAPCGFGPVPNLAGRALPGRVAVLAGCTAAATWWSSSRAAG
jgi:hypothetical protein